MKHSLMMLRMEKLVAGKGGGAGFLCAMSDPQSLSKKNNGTVSIHLRRRKAVVYETKAQLGMICPALPSVPEKVAVGGRIF